MTTGWAGGNIIELFGQIDERTFYRGMSDLHLLATNFIRRPFLERLRALPRMQELPAEAFTSRPESPVFVSHPWRGPNTPDDEILQRIRGFVPNQDRVGLWIDYCCLPQRRRDGTDDRSALERRYFTTQLQYIPTILLKSQLVVLWDADHQHRAWCVIEPLLADIFKNVIMKQIHHCKQRLTDAVVFATQTYDPPVLCVVGGVEGTPVAKVLVPHRVKDLPAAFYNSMLGQLCLPPTLLTTLLGHVEPRHIDRYFEDANLGCTNRHDIAVLKQLLHSVCRFAGAYDVTTIRWSGRIPCRQVLPYIMANTSAFTLNLVDYAFE